MELVEQKKQQNNEKPVTSDRSLVPKNNQDSRNSGDETGTISRDEQGLFGYGNEMKIGPLRAARMYAGRRISGPAHEPVYYKMTTHGFTD